jgi:hypothetical protein
VVDLGPDFLNEPSGLSGRLVDLLLQKFVLFFDGVFNLLYLTFLYVDLVCHILLLPLFSQDHFLLLVSD